MVNFTLTLSGISAEKPIAFNEISGGFFTPTSGHQHIHGTDARQLFSTSPHSSLIITLHVSNESHEVCRPWKPAAFFLMNRESGNLKRTVIFCYFFISQGRKNLFSYIFSIGIWWVTEMHYSAMHHGNTEEENTLTANYRKSWKVCGGLKK